MVTGSRDWTDAGKVRSAFRDAQEIALTRFRQRIDSGSVVLIHGDADGLDSIADRVGREEFFWETIPYPADWKQHGKAAGPIRNQQMVDTKPHLVLAFPLPGSKGTWDAVAKAEKAGIPVVIPYPELAGERKR
jgi:hypothetical protein